MAFSFGFAGDDIDIDDTDVNNESSFVPSAAGQGASNSLPELVNANKHDMNEWVSFENFLSCIVLFAIYSVMESQRFHATQCDLELPTKVILDVSGLPPEFLFSSMLYVTFGSILIILQLSILPSQIYYNRLEIGGTNIVIARREIFDIRTQLMAEDNEGHDNEELISGLEEGDLKPNFYEGGFKTWECALDLAKMVTSETPTAQSSESQTNTHTIEVRTSLPRHLTVDRGPHR